jgi:peptidoglycan/xylan/chitin deacetylase (PgdA/CDA1 family)
MQRSSMRIVQCMLGLVVAASAHAARLDESVASIPILVYHRFAATVDDSMTVRTERFEEQLRYLHEHGYHVVALRDVVDWVRCANAPQEPESKSCALPPKPIAITVDDGHRSVYEVLLPIVLREKIPVTLFIYPSAISNASYAMTWDQLRTLAGTGLFDIQSHTYWHPNFKVERRKRTPSDLAGFVHSQLARSRERLDTELGTHVNMIAWPYGIYDDQLIAIAAGEGYVAGFGLDARRVDRESQVMALPRFLMVDRYTPAVLAQVLGDTQEEPQPGGQKPK